MKISRLVGAHFIVLCLSGCLQTRETQKEQDEKVVLKKQLNTLQTSTADSGARFQDLEEDNRRLAGRLEAMDARLNLVAQKADKANANQDSKSKEIDIVYKEEFSKINSEISSLKAQLAAIHDENRKSSDARAAQDAAVAAKAAESAKNPLASAESKFDKKMWKEAILDYEKFRSTNPKAKAVAMATYKIGVCFQELGLKEDAKAFFEEVVTRYPKAKEAVKAEAHLKALSAKKKKI